MKFSYFVNTVDNEPVVNVYFHTKHSELSWLYEDVIMRGYAKDEVLSLEYLDMEMSRVLEKTWASIPLTKYDYEELFGLATDMRNHFLTLTEPDMTYLEFTEGIRDDKGTIIEDTLIEHNGETTEG